MTHLRPQQGFTLMELIITMVIIGILTAIAIPNYTAYIQRSNRSEARNALLEAATWMERWRTERGSYDTPGAPGTPPATFPFAQVPATGTAKYTIALGTPVPGTTYAINAVAVGVMAGDACATLTINQTGQRTFTTGGGGTQELCWNR
ncbi:MAG: type IV pilin protein [Pseudomonadota bacterium]|nr:type IV pilin protein [Pseudomonadota bacterium]